MNIIACSAFRQEPDNSKITALTQQVFICWDYNDYDKTELKALVADIRNNADCLVKWLENPSAELDVEELREELRLSSVTVVLLTEYWLASFEKQGAPLTIKLLEQMNRPYFPVAVKGELLSVFTETVNPVHGLNKEDSEYPGKLKEQLEKFVLNTRLADEIKNKAFTKQVFLSYRKKDGDKVDLFMKTMHSHPRLESVPIWYDRFLTAGKKFNVEIQKAIDESSVFILMVTMQITQRTPDGTDNYVVRVEYPHAVSKNMTVLPIEFDKMDYAQLKELFDNLEQPLPLEKAQDELIRIIPDLPAEGKYSPEKAYLLGKAYLSGFFVEQDMEHAVRLFEDAASGEDEYAYKAAAELGSMYETGTNPSGIIQYDKALFWRIREAEIANAVYGPVNNYTARAYRNIGSVYLDLDENEKALENFIKALEIIKKTQNLEKFDADIYNGAADNIGLRFMGHPIISIASVYNNMALVYQKQGDYDKAQELANIVLEIQEDSVPENSPSIATAYCNIADKHFDKNEYDKAEELFNKALIIYKKAYGEEHEKTAFVYRKIALIFSIKGDHNKAEELISKAIKITESKRGGNHPETAAAYFDLANVYYNISNYTAALELCLKALEITCRISGGDSLNAATLYKNTANIYRKQENYEKALEMYLKVLDIREKKLGKQHLDTAYTYNDIAHTYYSLGAYNKALEIYVKTLPIIEKELGTEHRDTIITYVNTATIYYYSDEDETALSLLAKAEELSKKVGETELYGWACSAIAAIFRKIGEYDKSLDFGQKTLCAYKEVCGDEHIETAMSYIGLARTHEKKGEYDNALEFYNKALQIYEKEYGKEHQMTVEIRESIDAVTQKYEYETNH